MSATVLQTPDPLVPYSGCMAWIIDQSGPTPTEIKKLAYQIFNDAGDSVADTEAVTVPIGTGVIIDPIREARSFLRTTLPDQTLAGVVKDLNATDNFRISYFEQIFDITGTCSVTNTAAEFTGFSRVTRIAFQDWESYDLTDPIWLTRRPTTHRICRREHIMLSIWLPDSDFTIEATLNGKSILPETNSYPVSSDGDIFHIALPPSLWSSLSDADTITVSLLDSSGEAIPTFPDFVFLLSDNCNCCADREFGSIHFLEPLGGWSSLTFDCIDRAFQRRKNLFCRQSACDNGVLARAGNGGLRSRDAGSNLQLRMKKKIRNLNAWHELVEALLASNEMYFSLPSKNPAIEVLRVGFNLEDARVETLPEEGGIYELEVTGTMFKKYKTLNQ